MNAPELRDIHLPEASLWWPPAVGWWIALLLFVLLLLILPRLLRWIRHKPLKQVSMQQFRQIRERYEAGQNEREVVAELSSLLRRVTISYLGRHGTAATTGEQWRQQLQQLVDGAGFSEEQLDWLASGRYQANASIDIEALLKASEQWLRGLPRSGGHVSV